MESAVSVISILGFTRAKLDTIAKKFVQYITNKGI